MALKKPADHFGETSLEPIFQAVTDRDGKVQFVEMLVRPSNSRGAVIDTAQYIKELEKQGAETMLAFDKLMLQHAAYTLQTHAGANINVNVSALTVSNPRWALEVADTFKRQPQLYERLGFEITETAPIIDLGAATAFAAGVRSQGAKIFLDDCGNGHFTDVRNIAGALHPDALKVATAIVAHMDTDLAKRAVFNGFRDVARQLSIPTVVAEGVSTVPLLKHIQAAHPGGDVLMQGYLLGKPTRRLAEIARNRAVKAVVDLAQR